MSMTLLLMGMCMYAYMHACAAAEECVECHVLVYGEDDGDVPGEMTEQDMRNMLVRRRLARSRAILNIKFLRSSNIAIITFRNSRVAARFARRRTFYYNGQLLRVYVNSVVQVRLESWTTTQSISYL